ncbi:hypothetical protein NLU13_3637 [Sarocladium strictum]|uniref:Uncharacterized protein n=1 Tax=Sarocladium strictum TaxID=5046 RepID=A0AA39LAM7_SARSR|nr:hypothetical protein NLU13_3637 [Sarocladium strictum]
MTISALGDQPLSTVARWVSSPDERGTFNVLSDCILTLVLCVWTAIHLNIPKAREAGGSSRKRHRDVAEDDDGPSFLWKKVKYVVLALIMPEVVAAIAFNQWLEHRSLMKFINKETELGCQKKSQDGDDQQAPDEELAGPQDRIEVEATSTSIDRGEAPEKRTLEQHRSSVEASAVEPLQVTTGDDATRMPSTSKPSLRPTSWSPLHCWYAVMGGFTIENHALSHPFPFPNNHSRLTLTSDGIKTLAKHHPAVFPRLPASEIADKSKSSELAKLIVCTQISWFIINTIGRAGQGLPLTVLELNTAAHCICTFATYVFWWHKPLDIVQPTAVTLTEEAARTAAHMCVRSGQLHWVRRQEDVYRAKPFWKRVTGWLENEVAGAWELEEYPIVIISPPEITTFKLCVLDEEIERPSRWLKVHLRINEDLTPEELERTSYDASNSRARILDFTTILRLVQLADAHAKENPSQTWDHSPYSADWLTLANPNHPFTNLKLIVLGSSGYSFLAACTLYALVHGFAWNGPFRSKVELYLWRMGVLAFVPLVALTPIIFIAVWRRSDSYTAVDAWLKRPLRRALEARTAAYEAAQTRAARTRVHVCYALLMIPIWFMDLPRLIFRTLTSRATIFFYAMFAMLAFLTGRAFLVVEAFLALPYAPDGVFLQTQWLSYLPHFG